MLYYNKMSDTLDLTSVPDTEEPAVTETVEDVQPESTAPSTEEVVETVQTILTSDPPKTRTTEEKLDALIELLKSTSVKVEYDDGKYRWSGPLVNIREQLDAL
tara:strand:- start:521 stop:829 length:309 start_codon:yes stop_codon:yes gene_type:complete